MEELLKQIGVGYGNTPNLNVVNVSLNANGEIVIEDKMKGSSKLDFHMVGAVDFSGGTDANVTDIDDLDDGESSFSDIMSKLANPPNPIPINPTKPLLYVKEFIKSGLVPADGAPVYIEGIIYDRTEFSKNGSTLSSNMPQIIKDGNAFAEDKTKLSEVFSGTLAANANFTLVGTDINGVLYNQNIDLGTLVDGQGNLTPSDEVTYKQLMDTINMIVTGGASSRGETFLSYDGKIQFQEIGSSNTQATLSLFDPNSGDFNVGANASMATFNTNNALTVRDAKTDFFKDIDDMIKSVENYTNYPDADSLDMRVLGIENSIERLDSLQNHISRSHSSVGAQSNALTASLERTQILEISTMTLRSSVIDTDLAEASLKLTQLTLNYEAMLATIGKVSKLSLVNYL